MYLQICILFRGDNFIAFHFRNLSIRMEGPLKFRKFSPSDPRDSQGFSENHQVVREFS